MSTETGATAKKNRVVPVSQRLRAYESFREQIMNARLLPGEFVSQRELTERLGLPLGAVREMIPRLEAARLIVTVPKRGLQVAPVDLKLVRNAFQIRSMIESEAVRHFTRIVSDADLHALRQVHEDILRRAEKEGDGEALDADARAVDWGMHDRMVDAMGNEILSEIYRVNSLHVRLIRIDADRVVRLRVLPAMQEHLNIIAAIHTRDEDAAARAMTVHIETSKQRVLEAMLKG
ncbi:DNA-binding GntR family transcriptional regulator [Ancylobacter sp. 3268]|uniref:GntR family transcriptional regulator n=1 Tax=Ancylobacter sp. 3268 TaxID=2817752 RepID=UPI00285DC60C|nr:GntR family transcriptional regulator [Ancylobacter sp. 3268]MDR6953232.1 DNA-binding GntR family transcriptional regulator [Ancylobacter sp. 3268]